MTLDHQQTRLCADQGPAWSEFVHRTLRRERTAACRPDHDAKATPNPIERKLIHLRHFALVMAATVVSTAFIGVAVLPGLLGLDMAGRVIG